MIDDAALAAAVREAGDVPAALGAYSRIRVSRTERVQNASHDRATVNHLPDGPEQQARDRAFASQDPLSHSDWLYGYDAQAEARHAVRAGQPR